MTAGATNGSLAEVLKSLETREERTFGVGYITTPQAVTWVIRRGRELVGPAGPLALEWVYEARLFGADGDLRWRWHQDHGTLTVLDDALAAARGWTVLAEHDHQRTRLLRGSARDTSRPGWISMWDGQAAPYDIPLQLARGERAALAAIEYVQQDPHHGTMDVVAERFVGLSAWKGTK